MVIKMVLRLLQGGGGVLQVLKWKQHSSCPKCETYKIETIIYYLKLSSPTTKIVWNKELNVLLIRLSSFQNIPEITMILGQRLNE